MRARTISSSRGRRRGKEGEGEEHHCHAQPFAASAAKTHGEMGPRENAGCEVEALKEEADDAGMTTTRSRAAGAAIPPLPRPLPTSTTTRLRVAGATVPGKTARGGEAAFSRTKAAATI